MSCGDFSFSGPPQASRWGWLFEVKSRRTFRALVRSSRKIFWGRLPPPLAPRCANFGWAWYRRGANRGERAIAVREGGRAHLERVTHSATHEVALPISKAPSKARLAGRPFLPVNRSKALVAGFLAEGTLGHLLVWPCYYRTEHTYSLVKWHGHRIVYAEVGVPSLWASMTADCRRGKGFTVHLSRIGPHFEDKSPAGLRA